MSTDLDMKTKILNYTMLPSRLDQLLFALKYATHLYSQDLVLAVSSPLEQFFPDFCTSVSLSFSVSLSTTAKLS